MTKTALLAAAAAFAISAGSASAQGPVLSSKGYDVHATRLTIPNAGLKTLYSQNDHDGGTGFISQMFGSSYPSDQGADDFVVPSGSNWKISEVDVTGVYFNGVGPATSENVYFYRDRNGVPGKPVKSIMYVHGADNGGSFAITIPTVGLKAGHYWVSVQANLAFDAGGEWGWEDRSVQNNNPAVWRTRGSGWKPLGSDDPDFMFALKGRK